MHTPTSQRGRLPQSRPNAESGDPRRETARSRAFSPAQLAFLIGVPLTWAVLLWFHPSVERDDVYGSLSDQVATYQIVHVGTLIFIGLMGVALYLLVRDLPGKAATISRLASGLFVLFYGAWEAVIGLATGALVQHANGVPATERPVLSDAIQSLQDNAIVGDPGFVGSLGAVAWITAVIAAAIAVRRAGAPVLATVLLGLSLVVVSHPPPFGPIGLACFAGAVLVLHRTQPVSASKTAQTESPTPTSKQRSRPDRLLWGVGGDQSRAGVRGAGDAWRAPSAAGFRTRFPSGDGDLVVRQTRRNSLRDIGLRPASLTVTGPGFAWSQAASIWWMNEEIGSISSTIRAMHVGGKLHRERVNGPCTHVVCIQRPIVLCRIAKPVASPDSDAIAACSASSPDSSCP